MYTLFELIAFAAALSMVSAYLAARAVWVHAYRRGFRKGTSAGIHGILAAQEAGATIIRGACNCPECVAAKAKGAL